MVVIPLNTNRQKTQSVKDDACVSLISHSPEIWALAAHLGSTFNYLKKSPCLHVCVCVCPVVGGRLSTLREPQQNLVKVTEPIQ